MSNLDTLSLRASDRSLAEPVGVTVKNVSFGVNVYKNTISREECYKHIIDLENELSNKKGTLWREPESDQSLRVAVDFHMDKELLGPETEKNRTLHHIYKSIFTKVKQCIDDYSSAWGIGIEEYEPLNFVKYSYPSSYFELHIDHSPNTVRTVSAIVYLNDNYDGGELHFPRLDDLTIKPEAGDVIVFPSTFIYQHESKPMLRGNKYSVVAFTDYRKRR
jgi:hypothetical protein